METTMAACDATVKAACKVLRLPSVSANASRLADELSRQGRGHMDFLSELLSIELEDRKGRRAARRVKEAGIPIVKTLQGFDFRRSPQLPEVRIRQLFEGGYIDAAEPVIFVGEPGTGKTHLASALGYAAAQQGRRVKFVTASRLANELIEARDSRDLGRVIRRYSHIDLLVLDELAYLPLGRTDAELLFQVLGERHERRAVVVTTNLQFEEWTSVFPDPRLCKALLDRLTHHAHIIDTGETSIRLTEALARQLALEAEQTRAG